MRFLLDNWEVLGLIILLIASETLHNLFENMYFWDEGVDLDDAVYYLVDSLKNLYFILILFLLIPIKYLASKTIAFGLILWNIKELSDEVFYMAGINLNVFEENNAFWGQVIMISIIVLCIIVKYVWNLLYGDYSE